MDNSEQTLSIGASQIAASGNGEGQETTSEFENVKTMKEFEKDSARDVPCLNGLSSDCTDAVEDALLDSVISVPSHCNGENIDNIEETQESIEDEDIAEIDEASIIEIDASDIFSSPNGDSEKVLNGDDEDEKVLNDDEEEKVLNGDDEEKILNSDDDDDKVLNDVDEEKVLNDDIDEEKVLNDDDEEKVLKDDDEEKVLNGDDEEEEDTAEISDDDIILSNEKDEARSQSQSEDEKGNGSKGGRREKKKIVDQIQIDMGNSDESTIDYNNLLAENELANEDINTTVVSVDSEVDIPGCDTLNDFEQKDDNESFQISMEVDKKSTTSAHVENSDESIEIISEGETSVLGMNTASQNITSDSDGPQLILELSHDSGEGEPKLEQNVVDLADSDSVNKKDGEISKKDESDLDLITSVERISSLKSFCAENTKVNEDDNHEMIVDDQNIDTCIEKIDDELKFANNEINDKKVIIHDDIDKKVSNENKIELDKSDAMEVECTELSILDEDNLTDESVSKHSDTTHSLDETAESACLEDITTELNRPIVTSTDTENKGVPKTDVSSTDMEPVHAFVNEKTAVKSDATATESKLENSGFRKGKKLDQLLSKIASKAELEKKNNMGVPKKAKARKSCASASNPLKSSSSVSLSSSSSITSLTFNIKELEKRGVLDMPKPQKRKAFDPVKIRHIDYKDVQTDNVEGPSSSKISKPAPDNSSVKSPGENEIPCVSKGKIIKGRRRKGKKSGKYRLPGEKVNRRTPNSRKKDSEERQLSDSDVKTTVASAMSVTDKVRKSQQLEYKRGGNRDIVNSEKHSAGVKLEECSVRTAFNESLGLSRKSKANGVDSGQGVVQNALDIMTKNSRLSFMATPSSSVKKAKKSVRQSIDSTTHRTLDSFLKGATYNQMSSSLKLASDELSGRKQEESQISGTGDARKRKASESPLQTNSSTESLVSGQEEKKRKMDGMGSPVQTQMITLVPTGSPPVAMPVIPSSVSGATHPIILSPGASSGTQTLIQNGTINGLPMFQLVNSPPSSSSQPPQLLAIAQNQRSSPTAPRTTNFLQPKGRLPVLFAPVQMTPVSGSQTTTSVTQTTTVSSYGNQGLSSTSLLSPSSQSHSLLKHLISPKLKTQLPNGQLLNMKSLSKQGNILNGLYPVTPPKTPEDQLSETNSQDSMEVSPGGVVPPDKDVIPLCTCKISGASFQKMASAVTFCQSLDSVDGKVMGCCNKVANMQLIRPAVKIPFLAVCESHRKRLRAHQCCPGCGHYCTQGKFLQCKKEGGNSVHMFHEQCQVTKDGKNFCPHCGETSAQFVVNLTIQEHKPSVIKDNKPARTQKTARIHGNEKKTADGEDSGEDTSSSDKSKKVPTASEILVGPDKYSLERFLNSLEGERPKKYRHLPKCLYSPAYDNDLERVVYMLEDGHDASETYDDLEGQGALHAAAIVGSLPIVHVLIQNGASPHMQDKSLRTPLMYAAENNHQEVVSYLLRAGAIVNAKADDGMTSLHYASKMGNVSIIKQIMETEQVKIDITDDGGWTPLIWATEHKELESVKVLLRRNADPNLRDSEENTTLHWAAFAGSVAIVELLLTAGCDLDSLNMHGDRPLHIAARQDHYECVVLFLARGADVEAKNNKGETPLECCLDQNSAVYLALKVNKKLKKFGAKHMGRPEKLLHRDLSKGRENIPIPCVNKVDDDGIPQDYLYVTDNIETTNLHINRVIGSLQSCQCKDDCSSIYCACGKNSVRCWYDKFGRLLQEFNMLEPPLIFECNRACECWTTCNNRVVQNGVMSRLQVFKTEGRGWGCRTLVDIPRGTFICEYIGEHISDSEADRREDDSYLFDLDNRDGETYCIDARRYGNIARFINHLCEPNLVPVKVFVDTQDLRFPRICLFASRDILAQEELGFDYGEKFWIIKWKQFTCTCGSAKCRYSTETIQKTLEEYRQRHEEEAEIVPE